MSAIAAIFNRSKDSVDQEALSAMLHARPERGPDGFSMWCQGPVALGHQHLWLTPEEVGEQQPLRDRGCVVSADIRLDNRSDLCERLELPTETLSSFSDTRLLLRAYQRWGEACIEYLLGDFAFVLWDSHRRQLLMARDSLGVYGLCYCVDEERCLIASEPLAILTQLDSSDPLDDNRIAAFLAEIDVGADESFFKEIHYLLPGHALVITADAMHEWRYWSADPQHTIRYRSEEEYTEHYYHLLFGAVQSRLRSEGPIGISLSGGLDSTSIAVLAASAMGEHSKRLQSYSYVFDDLESCDEREFIVPVINQANIESTYLPCDDKWPLKDLDNWPHTRDTILADAFALLPAAVMAAAGKAGVRTLLTGYFGDVLFTGGYYWALDLMREGRFGQLARTSMAHRQSFFWRDAFFEYGLRRLIPDQVRHSYRRLRPRSPARSMPGIAQPLIARTDLEERFVALEPPAGQWPPGKWQRYMSLFQSANSLGPSAVRYQYNSHGLELSLPYQDRRLVEFVMAVPAYILGGPDYDRKLHRNAMKGLLPENVRLRRRRTSFAPLALRGLKEREWDKVQTIMREPLVVKRGYIDSNWLAERLTKGFDLSPDSGLLWRSLCLEMWLQRYWS